MKASWLIPWVILAVGSAARAEKGIWDPEAFGAKPDGASLCTEGIQKAIDACAEAGGGIVRFGNGRFLSGTIRLKSNVRLELGPGATLLGSTNIADYPAMLPALRSYTDNYVRQSLIAGEGLTNIALTGAGLIDGQGESFKMADKKRPYENRPYVIRLVNCRDVLVAGLRLEHSAMWMQHYLNCERVTLDGVRVWNYGNANNDGLDLDGCRDCIITRCIFESDDDAITLKSTFERPCERVTISDCIARSHCNAIKMGTESNGGFTDIAISNCTVTSPSEDARLIYGMTRGMCGVALEIVDGGRLERIAVSNITIHGVNVPLFLRLGDRGRPFKEGMARPEVGRLRDVVIANIVASGAGKTGCSITGLPGHAIEDVSISNVTMGFEGGGPRQLADRQVPELPERYPESKMFGDLPAYGFYCRHVRGLRFSGVRLRCESEDQRHAMMFEDVEDLALDGLDATSVANGAPVVHLTGCRGVMVSGCMPRLAGGAFLRVAGGGSARITLVGNHVGGETRIVEFSGGASEGSVIIK